MFFVHRAIVADVSGGIHDDLTVVGRICIDLLVPGHPCVKADFPAGGAPFADGLAFDKQAIFEEKVSSVFQCGLVVGLTKILFFGVTVHPGDQIIHGAHPQTISVPEMGNKKGIEPRSNPFLIYSVVRHLSLSTLQV